MYFGRDGIVSACCYSRNAPFGRFPEQTVEEIWESASANSMRASLRRSELPGGCDLCADQLYAGNFTGLLAKQFDTQAKLPATPGLVSRVKSLLNPVGPKRFPVRMDFELSNKCNLECAMCSGFFSSSIRANRENMPPLPQVYDTAFVDQLVPFLPHLTHAKFLGGEPFLIAIYYQIWEQLIEINPTCSVSITTNATVYSGKVKRVLEKLNCQIVVSLDSVVKPTYEAIRRNATFERTLAHFENFCEFNRRRQMSLWIAVCPMTLNAEEMPSLVDFASERGVRVFFNTVVFPRAYSLRAVSQARQRELLALYRANRPDPKSEIHRANLAALEGFCHQLEYWIEQPDAGEIDLPLSRRCSELLTDGTVPVAYRQLLVDLSRGSDAAEAELDTMVALDAQPVETLRTYFKAMWYLGPILQRDGMLPATHYDPEQERLLLTFLTERVGASQARKMYPELRRFPKRVLGLVGTKTASQIADLLNQHLASIPPLAQEPRQSRSAGWG
jgi:MoaA/NifB/PqqE/SkfB family radical SAM enzyme